MCLSIIFNRLCQCALPIGHIGTTWRIRLNLCFLRPTQVHKTTTQTTNRLVQPFLHSSWQKVPIIYNKCPFPPKLPLPMARSGPQVIHGSVGPPESSTQTASRSDQLFLHGSLVRQTDRQTDRPPYSVGNNRPHLPT